MKVRNLSLYGALLLLCQPVVSCSGENNSIEADRQTEQALAQNKTANDLPATELNAELAQHIIAFGHCKLCCFNR